MFATTPVIEAVVTPLDQEYVKGDVPPFMVAVALPDAPPLQFAAPAVALTLSKPELLIIVEAVTEQR